MGNLLEEIKLTNALENVSDDISSVFFQMSDEALKRLQGSLAKAQAHVAAVIKQREV